MNVHGDEFLHYDGDPEGGYDTASWNEYPVAAKVGTGLPPFNSSIWPPLNFVHYNVCQMGLDAAWVNVLFPVRNYYSNASVEDQAVLAYRCFTLDSYHDEMSLAVISKLSAGFPVYSAWYNVYDCGVVMVRDTEFGPNREIQLADIVILGDEKTRTTTVYTGSLVNPIGWWRVLQED